MAELREMAHMMNSLKKSDWAELHYCLFSGGLLWSDECPPKSLDEGAEYMFRYLIYFRSSLIAAKPLEGFWPYWHEALVLFPNWPGFAPERCGENPALHRRHKRMEVKAMRAIEEWDADEQA